MRVIVLEFLDTDVFNVSVQDCDSFLDPLIESWDIDLRTFAMEVVLNRRLAPGHPKKFEFVEREAEWSQEEPGLKRFLRDAVLSGGATQEELAFLKRLRFNGKRPTPLYYYRELQNLRDPLHFRTPLPRGARGATPGESASGQSSSERSVVPMHRRGEAKGVEKQLQLHGRKKAMERWAENKRDPGKNPKPNRKKPKS